jgi:hypothetical protein
MVEVPGHPQRWWLIRVLNPRKWKNDQSLMSKRPKIEVSAKFVEEWTLPSSATFGSSVRAKGILLEVRSKLPSSAKRLLSLQGMVLVLQMSEDGDEEFRTASATVARTLEGIVEMPVIPREVEDILTISTAERHRWLKDGRLQSAGTRTVKLRGRAKKITFHVFEPSHIEDLLDRDLVTVWREDDAMTAAENRRRAAAKAAVKRAQRKNSQVSSLTDPVEAKRQKLKGWEEFDSDGLLR